MDSTVDLSLPLNWSTYTERQKGLYNELEPKGFSIDEACRPAGNVVIDVEHDEEGNFVCCGLCGIGDTRVIVIFSLGDLRNMGLETLRIIAHNGHSDLKLLREWGINVKDSQLIHDTELYAHILQPDLYEYGLKFLSERYLGIKYPSYDDIVGKRTKKQQQPRITLDKQPRELVRRYNAWDCWATAKLYEQQTKIIAERDRVYFQTIEKPTAPIFRDMEARGIRVDLRYLRQLAEDFRPKLDLFKRELQNELGAINFNAPKQVLDSLHRMGIDPRYRGKPSLDKRGTLYTKFGERSIIQKLHRWNELETLMSSFVQAYLDRGQEFVHPFFNQCGTRTGRPSCSNPNLLQIPTKTDDGKLVRQMFIARQGYILGDLDFGQIEPRVLAHLSKDENLLHMFKSGTDFHEFTARRLGIDRPRAKILNLSVGYRATWRSVAQQLQCTEKEAQREIDKWWALFPGLRRWEDRLIYDTKRSGYVTTLYGARIPVDGLNDSDSFKRWHCERVAINNVTQGSAAEIMKLAMQEVEKAEVVDILVQVYDELLVETDEEINIEICQRLMENCVKLDVPLVVEYGTGSNWNEAKKA